MAPVALRALATASGTRRARVSRRRAAAYLGAGAVLAPLLAAAAAAAAPPAAATGEDGEEPLVERLLRKSAENKAMNDQDRLDRHDRREWRINKLAGTAVIPEPCDPRIDSACAPRLPALPMDRAAEEPYVGFLEGGR